MDSLAGTISNSYFRCLSYQDDPIPWAIGQPSDKPSYLRGVLREMENVLEVSGLTFYITWKLDSLPSYGNDVIAIVMGDEWSQFPAYSHRVLATFKCYGTHPQLEVSPIRQPSYLNALLAAKHVRMRLKQLPGALRRQIESFKLILDGRQPPPVYDFPLGYGNQLSLPLKPINDRTIDVFFAGSITQGGSTSEWSIRSWLPSPKHLSRMQMLQALDRLATHDPSIEIALHTSERFVLNALEYGLTEPDEVLDTIQYSKMLMDTKICLVPRGTSPETFRFYEGLRYGCVLITERLPNRWFYEDAPVIQVDDWSEIVDLIPATLNNSDRMSQLQKKALHWWKTRCSERAVGQYMARQINGLA